MSNLMGKIQLQEMIKQTTSIVDSSSLEDQTYCDNLMDDIKNIGLELEMEPSLKGVALELHETLKNNGFDEHAHQLEIDIAYASRNDTAAA
jgi:hypothetical protein